MGRARLQVRERTGRPFSPWASSCPRAPPQPVSSSPSPSLFSPRPPARPSSFPPLSPPRPLSEQLLPNRLLMMIQEVGRQGPGGAAMICVIGLQGDEASNIYHQHQSSGSLVLAGTSRERLPGATPPPSLARKLFS